VTYTLLGMTQQVMGELGLPQPTSVATSSDPQLIQFFNLFQREATELRESYPWTALQTLWIIQVANPITVLGDISEGSTSIINLSSTATFSTNPASYLITDSSGLLPVSTRLVSVNTSLSSLAGHLFDASRFLELHRDDMVGSNQQVGIARA
jgi:hypothetical protein